MTKLFWTIYLILLGFLVYTFATPSSACEWTDEMEQQFQESIDAECKLRHFNCK